MPSLHLPAFRSHSTSWPCSRVCLRRKARAVTRIALLAIVFSCFAQFCSGQSDGSVPDTDNIHTIGLPEDGTFTGDSLVSVQVENGNVHVAIPISFVDGRGLPISYKYIYNSKSWSWHTKVLDSGQQIYWITTDVGVRFSPLKSFGYGFSSKPNYFKCIDPNHPSNYIVKNNFVVQEPDGTKHALHGAILDFTPTGCGVTGPWPRAANLYAKDGSGWMLHYDSDGPDFIYARDGRKIGITFINGATQLQETIWDTNGNQIVGTYEHTSNDSPLVSITDSLGRSLLIDGGYYDSSGTLRQIALTTTPVTIDTTDFYCACGGVSTDERIHTITLPNGMTYTIDYVQNSFGQPSTITLPSGGKISFAWSGFNSAGPTLLSRSYIDENGLTTGTWTYQFLVYDPVAHVYTSTVTDPAGNDMTASCDPGTSNASCKIGSISYYAGSSTLGTLLKRVKTDYLTIGPPNGTTLDWAWLPMRVTTTLYDGPQPVVKKVETDWESMVVGPPDFLSTTRPITWSNPTQSREYDFGVNTAGGLLRKTTFTYLHTNNSSYLSRNIADRTAITTVYNGSGTQVGKTVSEYDVYTHTGLPMTASGAVQHDAAYGTSFVYRGSVTAVSRWRNTDNAMLSTIKQYDDAGNVISITDPRNNKTSFDYTDSWANTGCVPAGQGKAYVTRITNALTQAITKTYNSCTGSLASVTDANLQATTLQYDLMGRRIVTSFPDGGSTVHCYSDLGGPSCTQSGPPFKVVTTKEITGTVDLVNTTLFDGLGRVKQTQINSDPDGATFVDTTYDALGRVHSVSNPHRAGSASTDGTTVYQYDTLGRTCVVVPPDGTAVTSCPTSAPTGDIFTKYSGNTTTVTDEAGKSRKTQSDGLGRLTLVWEDPAGLNYQTLYQYDTLGNLTCVEQHGNATGTGCSSPPSSDATSPWRVRRFAYNSLSQLLTATNPESGAIGHSYDANGNLLTRTAPAPNQTGTATVVTSYSYDTLNRLTQKSYNDGSTPTVQFGYDGVTPTGCTTTPPPLADSFPIGRRTAMCDGSGATSWKHDEMGRTLQDKRKIGTAPVKNVIYTFNFDGSLKTLKYPSTATVKYTPTGAGRMLSAQDIGNSINYVQSAQYAPFGGLSSMTQGATPITTTNAYNSRLQPITLSAATPSATILSLSYDFHLSNGDNGNVFKIVNNRVGNRTQNFLYDSLNRIQQAYTTGSGGSSWGETFGPVATDPGVPPATPGIDAWGNLTNRSGVNGKNNTEPLNAAPASVKNQLNGNCHDAAGNVLLTTSNCPGGAFTPAYTYDAENRLLTAGGVTYTYDGDGKRVTKSNGTLYWTGMGSDTLAESDSSGNMLKEYIFFNGKRVARRDLSDGSVKYYFSDHLGSASVITNAAGAMPPLEESDYYPYGGEIAVAGGDPNTYKFTGKERDAESELDYFIARHYSAALGRFMQSDEFSGGPVDSFSGETTMPPGPLPYSNIANPQSLNKYSYVANMPVRFTDPTGHCFEPISALLCVGAGVAIANIGTGLWQSKIDYDNLVNLRLNANAAMDYAMKTCGSGGADCNAAIETAAKTQIALMNESQQYLKGFLTMPGTFVGGDIPGSLPDLTTNAYQDAVQAEVEREMQAQRRAAEEQRRKEEEEKRKKEEEERRKREEIERKQNAKDHTTY